MIILCKLGWHNWKPVMRERSMPCRPGGIYIIPSGFDRLVADGWFVRFIDVGRKCRRCGVRK